jgi:hypothetical protein
MSRSIHTTNRDLKRERSFSVQDGVPVTRGMTELEQDDIAKRVSKVNAQRKRQTEKQDAPGWKKLKLTKSGLAQETRKKRTSK